MSRFMPLRFGALRVPVILQAEAAECGLACLAMLLGAHGHRVDLATLRHRHPVSLKGSTLRDLMRLSDASGLATRAVRLELGDLGKLRLPCILHWGMNHFVVLTGFGRKGLTIHDPARGRRRVSLAEASREFTGVALEASPKTDFVRKSEHRRLSLGDLFRRAGGLRASLGQILLLSLCIEVAVVLMPIGAQIVVDEVIVSADRNLLATIGVGLGLLLAVQFLLGVARSWAIMVAGTTLNYQWNNGLFDHLARLPLDYFEKRHIGDVVSRFSALGAIQKALTNDLAQAVLDGIMSVGMLIMLFIYGGWLGGVAVATTAVVVGLRLVFQEPYRQATEESIVYDAKQQTHFMETVRGMASVKLLGLRERRHAAWSNHLVDSLNARLRLQRLDLLFGRLTDLLFGADRLLLLVLGAGMVLSQQMTLGMLVAFLAYKDQLTTRVSALVGSWFQLRMLNVQADRLADIVMSETEAELSPVRTGVPGVSSGDTLRVDAASFRYGEVDPWVLEGISLEIPSGCSAAITGPSGCGKTTLLKIMMGLLPAANGTVSRGGLDIRGSGAYRERIAGVLQDDGLFAGSIAENICGFDPHPDPAWIEACAARAAILNDIQRMPMGFETLVGDMGSTLSGGQKQRVILARALYRRPSILFLDEATSHLDEATETAIAAALRDLPMTRIIVAHRPATIAHCDMVFAFAGGRLENVSGRRKPAPAPFALVAEAEP